MYNNFLKLVLVFSLFISASILLNLNISFSQRKGAIKGFITDSASGESIPYATIQIGDTRLGTVTNVNGFYLLQNIPIGLYSVHFSAVGYNKITKTISIRTEEPILVNISLNPTPIEMQAVTKTANRVKEVYETNISAQVLTQEDLKLVPVAIERDVFRAMKVIPGISSTSDVTSQFYVRGGAGDQNLILLDNMMVYNPFHAFGLFSIFNSDAIKVSEILTGGFGPEFGGRLSSVINIITREGNRNRYTGKINLGMLSGQGYVEGPIYDGSFVVSFRKSYFDQFLHNFLNKDLPLSFYDLIGKVTYDASDDGRFFINGFISSDKINNKDNSEPDFSWLNYAYGVSYLQTFGDRFVINVSFSKSYFKGSMDPKGVDNKSKSESQIDDNFFNAKVEAYLANNDVLSIGLSYLIPTVNYSMTNTAGYYVNNSEDMGEGDLFANYKWVQLENIVADIGFRADLGDLIDQPDYFVEPRLSLKYKIKNDLSIKASAGRYQQRIITTSNEDDVIPLFETWIILNLPYHPEVCDQYILGMDGINFSENLNMSFQGYYKKFKNLVGYNLDKIDADDPDFAVGSGESYGFETFIKFHSDYMFGWVSYTLSWAEKSINNITFPPKYDRRHNLNLTLGSTLPYNIGFNVHWEITSGTPFTPVVAYLDRQSLGGIFQNDYLGDNGKLFAVLGEKNSKVLPFYHRLDVSLNKSFEFSERLKLDLNLDIINVYDNQNIFYFNRETGARINMLPFLPTFSMGVEF